MSDFVRNIDVRVDFYGDDKWEQNVAVLGEWAKINIQRQAEASNGLWVAGYSTYISATATFFWGNQ